MIDILREHLAAIDLERAHAALDGRPWAEDIAPLIFPLEGKGGLTGPGVLTNHHWQEVLAAAGLAPRSVRLKDFRSTAATVLDEEGVSEATAQRMLGHAERSNITRRHYTGVRDSQRRKAAQALGIRLLDGGLEGTQKESPSQQ